MILRKTPGRLGLFAALLLSFTVSSPARAESEEERDTVYMLRDVEVTAARRPIATVQTISGKELQAMSTTSIADALKYFAGVQIKDFGGLGGMKTINVRSLGAEHVGVYIDGVRLTNAQNGTVDLGKYSLSTLESVSLFNANKFETCQAPRSTPLELPYISKHAVRQQIRSPFSAESPLFTPTVRASTPNVCARAGRLLSTPSISTPKATSPSDTNRNMKIP